MPVTLESLIDRSVEMYSAIDDVLSPATLAPDERAILAATLADIALEHGRSLLHLIAGDHLNSALALARVQFDCVARAIWLRYAASDAKVTALYRAVAHGAKKEPNNMPGIEEMIAAQEQVDPPGVGTQLRALKDGSWRPMSSFVHGGIFALHERVRDLPETWRTHTLRNSNGLSVMAAMTFATCAAAGVNPSAIQAIQICFLDCGPDVVRTP